MGSTLASLHVIPTVRKLTRRTVSLTKSSRAFLDVEIGDVVRIEYEDCAVQRIVSQSPREMVNAEKNTENIYAVIDIEDWKLLGLPLFDDPKEVMHMQIRLVRAEDQIEMP